MSPSAMPSMSIVMYRGADHRGARQGAQRCGRRGGARPREHRVRLRRAPADEGRVQRAGLDGHRRLPDPPAPRRRGRHHALQLPGHGADVDVRQRHRHRQHLHPEALHDRPVALDHPGPADEGGRAAATASSTCSRATASPSAAWWSTPTSRPSPSWARRRPRRRSTRTARGRQARPGPRRSQEPHARAARRGHRPDRRRGRLGRLRQRR